MSSEISALPAEKEAAPVRTGTRRSFNLPIPWLTTTLLQDVRFYFLLQPLLWIAGVEQLAPAVLAPWILLKRLWLHPRLRIPRPLWPAILLLGWQAAHVLTVPRGEIDLFVKGLGTTLALVCLAIIVYNVASTPLRWHRVLAAVEWFGAITGLLGLLFVAGVWKGEFHSLFRLILPDGLVSGSHFFSTISLRSLGFWESAVGYQRVRATFWHPSSYASVLLVFFAVQWFQFRQGSRRLRLIRLGMLGVTLINLLFTFSRTTYVSFAVLLACLWWLTGRSARSRLQKIGTLGLVVAVALTYVLAALMLQGVISFDLLYDAVYEFRPFSLQVRTQIYEVTWQLVRQRPLWGWGTLVEIESLPSYFSAGSHSDYLSVLFQLGIPGLLLYLGFLGGVWYTLLRGWRTARRRWVRHFFEISIALMLAINVRQFTSGLLWDVYVASTIWTAWGLALVLYAAERSWLTTLAAGAATPTETRKESDGQKGIG